ncbi:MAG: anti-sigma factor antagonist [Planctomycetota bacterium]|nr:MAG: anti-sigma factor antagonist [Planctomycetota bacterium]
MRVDVQSSGSVAVLTPHGPLIRDEVEDFDRVVRDSIKARDGRVVIDFQHVPYLDSAGIEALLEVASATPSVTSPRFAQLGDTCREALDLTNVLAQLDVFDTVEHAIRSFKR